MPTRIMLRSGSPARTEPDLFVGLERAEPAGRFAERRPPYRPTCRRRRLPLGAPVVERPQALQLPVAQDGIEAVRPSTVTNNTASNSADVTFTLIGAGCFDRNNTSPDETGYLTADSGLAAC